MPLPLQYDWVNKVVTVPSPDTSLDMQYLVNQTRDEEDELVNLDKPHIINATGKQELEPGVLVGITVELINGWQVAFEARPGPSFVRCKVSGGNLVGGISNEPIKVTNYTQVNRLYSAAATIAEGGDPTDIADAVWDHTIGVLLKRIAANKRKLDPATGTLTLYQDDNTTVAAQIQVYSDPNGTVPYDGTMPIHNQPKIG